MAHRLQTQIVVSTATLIFCELQWLIWNLRQASDHVLSAPDAESVHELLAWRRLAFRLFPSQMEAFANTSRALCNLERLMGRLRFDLPAALVQERKWRRLSSNRRYTLALDAILRSSGIERTEAERVHLSDLLGKLRVARRQLAHPKLPTDLVPEAQESEILRRAMLGVLTEQSHVLHAVTPSQERQWIDIRLDRGSVQSGGLPSRQHLADDWDDEFYVEVEESRGKTQHLVFVMLVEILGKDSLWAMQKAGDSARARQWPGGTTHLHGILTRVLGATFFGEVEGTCGILSRAALYASRRGEIDLEAENIEWLECVSGLKPMKKASESVQKKIDLESQIKNSLMLYARAYSSQCDIDFRGDDWNALRGAIALRDRMYHPESVADLVPSSEDYRQILKAMGWFRATRDDVTLNAS